MAHQHGQQLFPADMHMTLILNNNSVFVAGGTTARLSQTGAPTLPAAPSNLTATASGTTSINLTWTDNSSNETGFVLQRSLSASSGFSTIISLSANTTTYSNTGLSASTAYYYRVQSVNAGGSSLWSNVASATTATPITPPTAPSNLVAVAQGCNTIKLTWTDNSNNETNFEVYRSLTSNGTYSKVALVPSNTTNYINTGLSKGKKYYYKVRAKNTAGNSVFSNKASAIATCPSSFITNEVLNDVRAYPNPVSEGNFTIELPSTIPLPVSLKLFNSSGQLIMSKELQQSSSIINTENLVNGVYFLIIYGSG
ncbi:MAG: fibronectin type III domain-containing protein [Bacteroidales bacterium]|nr:fibronectin type III domain-containing protein [Bacteroidales bacterium]